MHLSKMLSTLILATTLNAEAETIHRAMTVIEGKVFYDLITINDVSASSGNPGYSHLRGTLTVPGKFSIPLTGHAQQCAPDENYGQCVSVQLHGLVTENEKTYEVRYVLKNSKGSGSLASPLEGELVNVDGTKIGTVFTQMIFHE